MVIEFSRHITIRKMTTITKLIIGGFKSIRDRTEIPLAPLTFLFGPNSAGKSALQEALNLLRKHLAEKPIYEHLYIEAMAPASGLFGRTAYKEPNVMDGDVHTVALGVEFEDFGIDSIISVAEGEAPKSARGVLWAVDGSRVEIEIHEAPGASRASSSIRVDGHDLLSHMSDLWTVHTGHSDSHSVQLKSDIDTDKDWESRSLGSLVINLSNPLWNRIDLALSQVNFNRINKFASLLMEERKCFRDKLVALKRIAEKTTSELLQQLLLVDGDCLTIRTVALAFHARKWTDGGIDMDQGVDLPRFLSTKGVVFTKEFAEEYRTVENLVDWIITATNELAFELTHTAEFELARTLVSGDRGVLKDEEVIFEREWINGSESRNWERTEWGALVSDYAYWLGAKQVANFYSDAAHPVIAFKKADFVNEVLGGYLFAPRKYQITPAVELIERFQIYHPDEQLNGSQTFDLKVQLLLKDSNGRSLKFDEVGSGVSYILPVLVALWGSKASWIAQPELHLHPAAQCEMGDAIIRAFNRGRFSVTETHSEHLLLRVLRRIRQTSNGVDIDSELKCIPEAVSVLYFDPQDDGSTKIRQLRVTRQGDFKDRWPNGFFEERGRELFDE